MMNYRQATTLFFQLVTICVMAIRFQCIFMDGRNLFKISMIYNSVCGCWHIDSGIACDLLDWLSFVIDLLLALSLSTVPPPLAAFAFAQFARIYFSQWLHGSTLQNMANAVHFSCICMMHVHMHVCIINSQKKLCKNLWNHSDFTMHLMMRQHHLNSTRLLYEVWRCGYLNLIENASML